jgi:PAS domain S-box-containing protein
MNQTDAGRKETDIVFGGSRMNYDPKMLERIFDCLPDVLYYIKDVEARYLSVNQSLVDRSGLSRKEVLGKTADQVFPVTWPSTTAQDLGVIQSRTPIIDRLRLYSSGNGSSYWCLNSAFPIEDGPGTVIGLIGVSRDLPRPGERHHSYGRLLDFLTHLEQNIGANILVSDAAARASISIDALERLTREVFHLTPKQVLMKMRIDLACKLLEATDDTITNVASACGYADHSAFTRKFKSATHMTPRQYRAARGWGLKSE